MTILTRIVVSIIISAVASIGVYKYVPLSWIEPESKSFGTTIQSIAGTDTLSSSRTTINNNFTALNNGKFELSDWYATTSARQLTNLGIMSGGLVTVAYGGTASSSLSSNQVLLGNTTSGFKTVAGYGTTGQFLTSNGVGSAPTWTTSAIDQAGGYTWTGSHSFSLPVTFNGASITFPSTQGSNGGVFSTNGAGTVTWKNNYPRVMGITSGSSANGATTTVATITIPANDFGVSKQIRITAVIYNQRAGNPACGFDIQYGNGSATTTIATINTDNYAQDYLYGEMKVNMFSTTTAVQINNGVSFTVNAPGGVDTNYLAVPLETARTLISHAYSYVNMAAQSYISFATKLQSGTGTCAFHGATVELLSN